MKCRICDKTIGVADQRSYVIVYKDDTTRKVYACGDCQATFDRWIDALPTDENGNPIDVCHAEAKAWLMATNRKALEKRLRAARAVLTLVARRDFGRGRFDFDERTLTGDNGMMLEWGVRDIPDKPVAYLNQQTTEGTVSYRFIDET